MYAVLEIRNPTPADLLHIQLNTCRKRNDNDNIRTPVQYGIFQGIQKHLIPEEITVVSKAYKAHGPQTIPFMETQDK